MDNFKPDESPREHTRREFQSYAEQVHAELTEGGRAELRSVTPEGLAACFRPLIEQFADELSDSDRTIEEAKKSIFHSVLSAANQAPFTTSPWHPSDLFGWDDFDDALRTLISTHIWKILHSAVAESSVSVAQVIEALQAVMKPVGISLGPITVRPEYEAVVRKPDQPPGTIDWKYMRNRLVTAGVARMDEVSGLGFATTLDLLKHWEDSPPLNESQIKTNELLERQLTALPKRAASVEHDLPKQAASAEHEPTPTKRSTTPHEGKQRKRGPKPDNESAARVSEIVTRMAPDGNWRVKVDDICEALDQAEIPFPRRWRKRDRSCDGWAAYDERANAVKAIEYRLEIAKGQKKTTRETFS